VPTVLREPNEGSNPGVLHERDPALQPAGGAWGPNAAWISLLCLRLTSSTTGKQDATSSHMASPTCRSPTCLIYIQEELGGLAVAGVRQVLLLLTSDCLGPEQMASNTALLTRLPDFEAGFPRSSTRSGGQTHPNLVAAMSGRSLSFEP